MENPGGCFFLPRAREGSAMSLGRETDELVIHLSQPLKNLTPEQILEIDRALEDVGPFGEVRLIKAKGKVRFIQRLESRELPRGAENR